MSEFRQQLAYSLGSPRIFSLNYDGGEPIIVIDERGLEKNAIDYITSFSYTYDEENDDECKIEFTTLMSNFSDNKFLDEDTKLEVQWGWLTHGREQLKSPIRKIVVTSTDDEYTDSGFKVSLTATDLAAHLKKIRLNKPTKQTLKDNYFELWLKELLAGQFKATITIPGKMHHLNKEGQIKRKKMIVLEEATGYTDDPDYTPLIPMSWKDPDEVVVGSGKAINLAIQSELDAAPGGPYYMDGRDDTVNIKKRDFGQEIFKEIQYNNGSSEVVRFSTKIDKKEIKDDTIESSNVNPENSTTTTTQVTTTSIVNGVKVTKDEMDSAFKEIYDTFEHNMQNPYNQKDVDGFVFTRTIDKGGPMSRSNREGTTSIHRDIAPIDLKFSVATKDIIQLPGFNQARKDNIAKNYIMKKVEKRFTATLVCIGDPSLIVSKIINILGLSRKDSGRWYIIKVKHSINTGGFICELDLIRKPITLGYVKSYIKKSIDNNGQDSSESIDSGSTKKVETYDGDGVKTGLYQPISLSGGIKERLNILSKEDNLWT